MKSLIEICGVILVILGLMHLVFPKYFKWKTELKSLSLINREMMKVHTFFIGVTVFLMGVLCLTNSNNLINTEFGKTISLGLGFFWGLRLIIQFYGYSSDLWKGKKFETIIHIFFSLIWSFFTFVFLYNYFE
ncbi:MAG TPA: hypothetical protein DIS94_03750 [Bacteroidetes bacterium]|nr:hypothetical protein [Bacteroidota bacterium]